jgi:hypothetical protein
VSSPYCCSDCRRAKKQRHGGECVGCGRAPNPSIKVSAPICDVCSRAIVGACLRLSRYDTRKAAAAGIRRGPHAANIAPFTCLLCGGWHLARRFPTKPKAAELTEWLHDAGVRVARGAEPILSGDQARRHLTSGAVLPSRASGKRD